MRNEFLEAWINPTTGSLRSVYDYRTRGNRLSQQLAFRGSGPPRESDDPSADPDLVNFYFDGAAVPNDADDTAPVEYEPVGDQLHAKYANGVKLVMRNDGWIGLDVLPANDAPVVDDRLPDGATTPDHDVGDPGREVLGEQLGEQQGGERRLGGGLDDHRVAGGELGSHLLQRVRLLDGERRNAAKIVLDVPRAAGVRVAQAGHDVEQSGDVVVLSDDGVPACGQFMNGPVRAAQAAIGRLSDRPPGPRRLGRRKRHLDERTAQFAAPDIQRTAVGIGEFPHDRQAQAVALDPLVAPHPALQQALTLPGLDTRAVVLDDEHQAGAPIFPRDLATADPHPRAPILERVVEQVAGEFQQVALLAVEPQLVVKFNGRVDHFVRMDFLQRIDDAPDRAQHRDRRRQRAPRRATSALEPRGDEVLLGGDLLLIEGQHDDLDVLRGLQELEIETAVSSSLGAFESERLTLMDATLDPRSQLAGRTVGALNFRERYGIELAGIWREGETVGTDLANERLQIGDALLLLGPRDRLQLLSSDSDFLVLTPLGQEPPDTRRAPLAAAIMFGVVLAVMLGYAPISIAAVIGGTIMVLTGCLNMEQAYRAIDWRAIFLIAGMLPLGTALDQTGAAKLIADGVVALVGPFGPKGVMLGLVALTFLSTCFVPTAVLVVLMVPIALNTSAGLGISPHALMMGIAMAASSSFTSPISHPANVLVMGPGGYRFIDYLKVGIPLTLLILLSFAGPLVYDGDPDYIDFSVANQGPSREHPFGTDSLGRDMLARTMFGGRISIAVGISAMLAANACGCTTIIAVDINAERLEAVKTLGATHTINTSTLDPAEAVKEITEGRMADLVIEAPEVVTVPVAGLYIVGLTAAPPPPCTFRSRCRTPMISCPPSYSVQASTDSVEGIESGSSTSE